MSLESYTRDLRKLSRMMPNDVTKDPRFALDVLREIAKRCEAVLVEVERLTWQAYEAHQEETT